MITYVAVNVAALKHNVQAALGHLHPHAKLMAVVKANAYGHGLVPAARAFVDAGAAWLGVSTVAEGVSLREAGLDVPVLVFLPPLPEEYEPLVEHRLTATLLSVAHVRGLGETARRLERTVFGHVYADTGLGRLGSDDSLPDVLAAAPAFAHLRLSGAYTHFGPPGSGRMMEELDELREGASLKTFAGLVREAVSRADAPEPLIHAAASALFLEQPANHLDMVRLGTLLYGQYPDHVTQRPLALREDTFSLRSRIIALQTLPAGSRVGYGGEFICRRETRVATVPVGTAHGLAMTPQSHGGRLRPVVKAWLVGREGRRGQTKHAARARLDAHEAPLIGRVSMDQCCLDVTDVPAASLGVEVALPVRRLAVDGAIPRIVIDAE